MSEAIEKQRAKIEALHIEKNRMEADIHSEMKALKCMVLNAPEIKKFDWKEGEVAVIGAEFCTDNSFDLGEGIQFRSTGRLRSHCLTARLLIHADADFYTMKELAKNAARIIEDMTEEDFDRLQETAQEDVQPLA